MRGNVRTILAHRLRSHATRAGIPVTELPTRTGLSQAVIDGYFCSSREIRFDELRPVCKALRVRLITLLCRDGPYELFGSDREFAAYDQRCRAEIEKLRAE